MDLHRLSCSWSRAVSSLPDSRTQDSDLRYSRSASLHRLTELCSKLRLVVGSLSQFQPVYIWASSYSRIKGNHLGFVIHVLNQLSVVALIFEIYWFPALWSCLTLQTLDSLHIIILLFWSIYQPSIHIQPQLRSSFGALITFDNKLFQAVWWGLMR